MVGFSVLIISGSNLKLIFSETIFFFCHCLLHRNGHAGAGRNSFWVHCFLPEEGWHWELEKRLRDLGKYREILVLEHPLTWLKLRQCRFETLPVPLYLTTLRDLFSKSVYRWFLNTFLLLVFTPARNSTAHVAMGLMEKYFLIIFNFFQ